MCLPWKSIKTFYQITGSESQGTVYKELRLQQISKSKENVKSCQNFLIPFSVIVECEKQKLLHLSPGAPLPDEIAVKIINTFCRFMRNFLEKRLLSWYPVSEKQFYVIMKNLSKIHYKVKRWKNENCRNESKYIKGTWFLPHNICIVSRLAKTFITPLCSVPSRFCNLVMVQNIVETKAN